MDVVENGQLAVQMFEEKPENYYDFILMDIQMPVMDGRKATETIRLLDRPDAQTVLIFGLSADAFMEDEAIGRMKDGTPIEINAIAEHVFAECQKL